MIIVCSVLLVCDGLFSTRVLKGTAHLNAGVQFTPSGRTTMGLYRGGEGEGV